MANKLKKQTGLSSVSMYLTDEDRDNADFIYKELGLPNKAHSVSTSLALLTYITSEMEKKDSDMILYTNSRYGKRIIVPELEEYKKIVKKERKHKEYNKLKRMILSFFKPHPKD